MTCSPDFGVLAEGLEEIGLFFFRNAGPIVTHPEADETIGLFVSGLMWNALAELLFRQAQGFSGWRSGGMENRQSCVAPRRSSHYSSCSATTSSSSSLAWRCVSSASARRSGVERNVIEDQKVANVLVVPAEQLGIQHFAQFNGELRDGHGWSFLMALLVVDSAPLIIYRSPIRF